MKMHLEISSTKRRSVWSGFNVMKWHTLPEPGRHWADVRTSYCGTNYILKPFVLYITGP